ncbi:MAG: ZIP family metal transporter [Candidatus Spechtbacterales bacterium]|nr:ZIP family metal transporter [Candidatus Spechtbacterales bacterium]
MLGYIILFSIFGSILSLAGGVLLLWKNFLAEKLSLFLISFAAGVLLGVAFLDLIPEGIHAFGSVEKVSIVALITISILFFVERFLWWYHHHRMETEEHTHPHHTIKPGQAYLLLFGDTIHNFIDGVLITAAFLTDFRLGVGVAIGIIAHELPQEIADFSVMLNAGFKKKKVLGFNLLSSLATLIGAVGAYYAFSSVSNMIPYAISAAAGVFIYVALSDLIPTIHHQSEHSRDTLHFVLFASGILLVFILGATIPHADIEQHNEDELLHHIEEMHGDDALLHYAEDLHDEESLLHHIEEMHSEEDLQHYIQEEYNQENLEHHIEEMHGDENFNQHMDYMHNE